MMTFEQFADTVRTAGLIARRCTSDHCWCRAPLTRETARMDHIVPLYQGGSNRRDNLCLACVDCDLNKRGNKAIKPKIEVNAAAADEVFASMSEVFNV